MLQFTIKNLHFEAGWFPGESFVLFELTLLKFYKGEAPTIFCLSIAKFSITLGIE